MPDVLSLLASAALGGLFADIAGKSVWSYIRRPKLKIDKQVKTRKVTRQQKHGPGKEIGVLYQGTVTNEGKNAAKNCKPRLILKGDNIDVGDEDRDYEHTAEVFACWSESTHPSRITINPGETASFDLLKVDFESHDERNQAYLPSEVGWEENTALQYRFFDSEEVFDTVQFLAPRVIEESDWTGSQVEVTAENAEKDRLSIDMSWNDEEERANVDIF